MKVSNLTKFVSAGVLAASLAVIPSHLPASAQQSGTTSTDGTNTTNTAPTQGVSDTSRDNDFDWGWLGLLGLAGLAGLAGRKRHDDVRYRTDEEVRNPNYTNYGR
jgi:MYXO-CTERM domain-containing protein